VNSDALTRRDPGRDFAMPLGRSPAGNNAPTCGTTMAGSNHTNLL